METQGSRTNKAAKNMTVSVIFYITKILLSFLVRTIFIRVFGVEYLGLNSIFANVLTILSLAELGIGSAIVFSMYKPMAEGDTEKLKSLLDLYKKFYLVIALIVLCVGLALIPFLSKIIDKDSLGDLNITVLYLISLSSTVISYLMAHRRALLYTSQNKFVETIISLITNILLSILQIVVLLVLKNYYFYISLNLIVAVVDSFLIYIITIKMFPEIKGKCQKLDKETTNTIIKNTKAMFLHKIGGVALNATDTLIMQIALGSLIISGIFSNYLLIYTTLIGVISMIIDAAQASVGNLIATKDGEYSYTVFNKLNFCYSWLIGFCSISLLCLYNPFISTIWGAQNTWDMGFVLVYSLTFYINMSRQLAYSFKTAAGIFRQDRYAPILEALLNIVLSYVLVKLCGPVGVILGTLISCLLVPFWYTPFMLFKLYFKLSIKQYWIKFLLYTLITIVCGVATYFVCGLIPSGGIGWLLVKFIVCAIVPNVLLLLCYFWTPEFKQCVAWGKELISNFKNRKHKVAIGGNIEQAIDGAIIESEVLAGTTTEIVGEPLQDEVVTGEIDFLGKGMDKKNTTNTLSLEGVVFDNNESAEANENKKIDDK